MVMHHRDELQMYTDRLDIPGYKQDGCCIVTPS